MAYSKICVYCHVVTLEGTTQSKENTTSKVLHNFTLGKDVPRQETKPVYLLILLALLLPKVPAATTINQEQKSADIKAAQEERRQQHRELIIAMQNLTKAIIADIASRKGDEANDIVDSMAYEQYREDKRDFQDEVV